MKYSKSSSRYLHLLLIGFLSNLSILTTTAYQQETPTSPPVSFPILDTPSEGDIGLIIDNTGASLSLKTFEVHLQGDMFRRSGDLGWPERWLFDIYGNPRAIPLRQDNIIVFVSLDKISEYHLIDNEANIVLTNGEILRGIPLIECNFSGETLLGVISIPAQQVQGLKFDQNVVKQSLAQLESPNETFNFNWPGEYQLAADISLSSGLSLHLEHVAFVQERGCQTGNCDYVEWDLANTISVKYGGFEGAIDLANVDRMTFDSDQDTLTDESSIPINIVLFSGEEFAVTIPRLSTISRYSDYYAPEAILGTIETGYVHIPIRAIQSIDFEE